MPLESQFTTLMALNGLAAVFWLLAALSAVASHRAFRQSADLWWAIAFSGLAFARAGSIFLANDYLRALAVLPLEAVSLAEHAAYYGVRFGAVELAAAFVALYVFRSRRARF
jgi:hypothetical protein